MSRNPLDDFLSDLERGSDYGEESAYGGMGEMDDEDVAILMVGRRRPAEPSAPASKKPTRKAKRPKS